MQVKENYISLDIFDEVKEGLSRTPKRLPSKLFYDEKGSALFDEICNLEEYYPTRTEIKIMQDNIREISELLGEGTLLIELGSGSSIKTKLLLDNISGLAGYVPVDISAEHLYRSADTLQAEYPHIDVYPVAADYTGYFEIPLINKSYDHVAVYFPGSTIGNFTPDEAKRFLKRIAGICGSNGGLIIGVDLKKKRELLENAYNDKKGITAAFNLNILEHINKELGTSFNPDKFRHFAFYNELRGRIEMHLISRERQEIRLDGTVIHLNKGENILTEYSYKYSPEEFAELVKDYFKVRKVWTDINNLFSIQYLRTFK